MTQPSKRYDFPDIQGLDEVLEDIIEALKDLDKTNFRKDVNMEGINLNSGSSTMTSVTIDGNTLGSGEFQNLDGIDQSVKTTSDVTFNDITVTTPSNIYALSHDSFADFLSKEHIDWTNTNQNLLTTGGATISGTCLFGPSKMGNDTNYLEVESDGSLVFKGNATVWNDYVTPLTKATFGGASNDPTLTKIFDDGSGSGGVWGLVFSDGDEVLVTIQMPHGWKLESTIYPHIHVICLTDVDPTDNYAIEFEYTWCDQDKDFEANTTLVTKDDIPTLVNSQYRHQLVNIPDAGIAGTGHTLSSILMCRIKRVAATTDNYAGGICILDFDIHYEIDTVGSRQISIK